MTEDKTPARATHVPANKLYYMATEDDSISTVVPEAESKGYDAWARDRDE